jgi:hypothetical protein
MTGMAVAQAMLGVMGVVIVCIASPFRKTYCNIGYCKNIYTMYTVRQQILLFCKEVALLRISGWQAGGYS